MFRKVVVGIRRPEHLRLRRLKHNLARRRLFAFLRRLKIECAAKRAEQAQNEAKHGDGAVARQNPALSTTLADRARRLR